ncbi:baseplate J/gp47 family protein [Methylovirgula sp. 4M-Z18]|uniref:baseplate J/gp47 family protein n=1 Tax=Methylovirgula sp. 4M-Z18 TaxID=2293567 RepID=UPI000E2E846F|nr:baseplate J/gp47 family protein [Methylovirgula sp. 4M-Z18]RFB80027.1 baseplate protein [Methylovirgula sp. 4M-Z18]
MANLTTQSFSQLVQNFAAAVQARSSDLIDFSQGAILRAVAEADAANALWLQALIVQVLGVTRAQTSNGSDLDSFVQQFGLTRLGAASATGQVIFSRFTASTIAPFIPLGTLVRSADGSQQFSVTADATNTAYSAVLGGYTLASGAAAVNAPVAALAGGTAGNVAAGTITLIASTIPGVDTVVNGAPLSNGVDAESDAALRSRFVAFIGSLSKATDAALTYAIQSLQVDLQVAIHENVDPNGASDPGMITIFVDDGSGNPPAALIAAANTAVQAVRAAGIRASVYPATTLLANVAMAITTASGYVHQNVVAQVAAALGTAIANVGLENTLAYNLLPSIAFGVPGVANVSSVVMNSTAADLVPGFGQTIKPGIVSVT